MLPDKIADMSYIQIDLVLSAALNNAALWNNFGIFFDKDVTLENKEVRYIRTMLQLAGPLEVDDDGEIIRYNDMNDREGEHEQIT